MSSSKVIFSLDDFCDEWWPIKEMVMLKERYPNFKITVFTIPMKTNMRFLGAVKELDWIEIAVHGFEHDSLDEMLYLTKEEILEGFSKLDFSIFTKGFKAPGWRLNETVIEACNEMGMWVALYKSHVQKYGPLCKNGFYAFNQKYEWWFAHTHDVENNWIKTDLPMLMKKWVPDQEFLFISEAIEKC